MLVIRALGVPAALLLAVSVPACAGDESGPPRGASVEDFCAAYFELFTGGMLGIDPTASEQEQGEAMVEVLRAWAEEMGAVGAPDDMSDEARGGFDLIVSAVTDLEPGDVDHLAELDDQFSEHQIAATGALEEYATQNCESPFGDTPPS
jgi:hypothetical protein